MYLQHKLRLTHKGRFLLAFLHLELLKTKNDVRSLKEALNSLPEGLNATYDEAMERIRSQNSDDCDLAMKVLYWIHYAFKPLTLEEIQNALAVRPGDHNMDEEGIPEEERLLSVCAGLVTLQSESKEMSMVHFSTQEYFKRKADEHFPQGQDHIATICLTYLSFENFGAGPCTSHEELEERLQEYPFLEYAALYWGDHFCQGSRKDMSLVLDFLREDSKTACCIQIIHERRIIELPGERYLRYKRFKESQKSLRDVHSLWLAAYFGMTDVIKVILEQGTDVTTKTGYGETALHPATRCGSVSAVKALLAAGADINAPNESRNSPLSIAVSNTKAGQSNRSDYEAVVRLLLDEGAEVTAKYLDGFTALHKAVMKGNEAVVKLLLANGADVEMKDQKDSTALHLAANWGYEALVKLLLENGANIEAKNKDSWTALYFAARNGNKTVVKLLLEKGANIEAKNKNGWTALFIAAGKGNEAVVKLLLENEANIEAKNKDSWTILSFAASIGNEAVVKLLLEKGANIEAKNKNSWTALFIAAGKGNEAMVKLLLENGANIEAKNKNDWTALHFAASNGNEVVVKLLLEKGADIQNKNKNGQTALDIAAWKGHEAVVKLLLANGADIQNRDDGDWTALKLAAYYGHEAVVELLLANGADIQDKDINGWTALDFAAENGHEAVIKVLEASASPAPSVPP